MVPLAPPLRLPAAAVEVSRPAGGQASASLVLERSARYAAAKKNMAAALITGFVRRKCGSASTPRTTLADTTSLPPAITTADDQTQLADGTSALPPFLANPPLPAPTSLEEAVDIASRSVWGVDLRPMQREALVHLLGDAHPAHKLLLVTRTGSGKSHVTRMLGTMLRGIHLVMHPLLVLAADQAGKFTNSSCVHGSISALNLDDAGSTEASREILVRQLLAVAPQTSRTIFLFASPQYLARHRPIRRALLGCARRGTFRSCNLDEAHLLAKHAATFRPEIRMMSHTFLRPLQASSRAQQTFLLCTTATDSVNDHKRLERITHTGFPPEYTLRSTMHAFRQRRISMSVSVGRAIATNSNRVLEHLRNHPSSVFCFANTKPIADKITLAIEKKISEQDEVVADAVQITGAMDKRGKGIGIRLFTGALTVDGMSPRICVATNAGDMGIDHPDAQLIVNFGFVEDCSTFVQRRGRASRRGEDAAMHTNISLVSYLYLVKRLSDTSSIADEDDVDSTAAGFNNSELSTPSRQNAASKKIFGKYALSNDELKKTRSEQLRDFMDVADLLCLSKGCVHWRIESFCHTGTLSECTDVNDRCDGKCPICSGDFSSTFLPVNQDGVRSFLERCDVFRGGKANADGLIACIWKSDALAKSVFGLQLASIHKYNIEAMFLQLLATRLIEAVVKNGELV